MQRAKLPESTVLTLQESARVQPGCEFMLYKLVCQYLGVLGLLVAELGLKPVAFTVQSC